MRSDRSFRQVGRLVHPKPGRRVGRAASLLGPAMLLLAGLAHPVSALAGGPPAPAWITDDELSVDQTDSPDPVSSAQHVSYVRNVPAMERTEVAFRRLETSTTSA